MFEKFIVNGNSFIFVFGYFIKTLIRLNNPKPRDQYSFMELDQDLDLENKKGIKRINVPINNLENMKNPIIVYNILQ